MLTESASATVAKVACKDHTWADVLNAFCEFGTHCAFTARGKSSHLALHFDSLYPRCTNSRMALVLVYRVAVLAEPRVARSSYWYTYSGSDFPNVKFADFVQVFARFCLLAIDPVIKSHTEQMSSSGCGTADTSLNRALAPRTKYCGRHLCPVPATA
jgi:hypothetical protein